MTDEAVNKFLGMIRDLAQSDHRIKEIKAELQLQESHNRLLLLRYETERTKLVEQGLLARGLAWCTKCTKVFEAREVKLMLFKESSDSYENSCHISNETKQVHRVCLECRKLALGLNGYTQRSANGQAKLFLFPVKTEGGRAYFQESGKWQELPEKLSQLDKMPSLLVDELCRSWDLPAKIVDTEFDGEVSRLIRKQIAKTRAS